MKSSDSGEISERIKSLRFLLVIFVVFIHNNYTQAVMAKYIAEGRGFPFVQNEFGRWVQLFLSDGIARCAVPLLFLFSAYFQSLKDEPFTTTLKKKFRSLLVPYVIWIVIYGLYFTFGKLVVMHFAPSLVGNHENTVLHWTGKDWFFKFLGYGAEHDGLPGFAYHFWFMRDLMILVVLFPVLRVLVRRIPLGFFFFVGGWYLLSPSVPGVSNQALFFYVCGLYWGEYKLPLLEWVDRISWGEGAALFCGAFFVNYYFYSSATLYWLMVLAACILLLKLSHVICSRERLFSIATTLSGYSFGS